MEDRCYSSGAEGDSDGEGDVEAADPEVFNWYDREFCVDVNLFVDHSQAAQLACLRRGIWRMADTFGKITTFRPGQ